ncbi:MAG: tetratricopeptide repeat protein [Acidobacteria bacterium]|nr:tetratricopeptide repeat protein [Acidobacteriota bacterium]MCK6683766.1 tetratricopeptide repeat protein [Thermoanaerobaculia bacterium]
MGSRLNKTALFLTASTLAAAVVMAEVATPSVRAAQTAQALAPVRAAMSARDYDKAIEAAEGACKKDPGNSELTLWLGRAYGMKAVNASIFSKMSWAKKCKAAFEKAVELDPSSLDARFELMRYHINAPGIAGGDLKEAYRQAEEIGKRDAGMGHVARGAILEKEEKPKEAEAEYRLGVKTSPNENQTLLALSAFLSRNNRHKEAVALWEERLTANPQDMLARYQIARFSLAGGIDLDKAAEHLKAYLAKEPAPDTPTWADANWRLGLVYEKMGKKTDAVKALEKALELNPTHQAAKKDLERLRKA